MTETPDTYSEAETVTRREAALKYAFTMPHKPHGKVKESSEAKKRGRPAKG